jgi:flavin-binding protein dodecin
MSNHVYSISEIVGSAPDTIEGAIDNAMARANKTLRNVEWFQVVETRGHVVDGAVGHYQVTIKVGFRMED